MEKMLTSANGSTTEKIYVPDNLLASVSARDDEELSACEIHVPKKRVSTISWSDHGAYQATTQDGRLSQTVAIEEGSEDISVSGNRRTDDDPSSPSAVSISRDNPVYITYDAASSPDLQGCQPSPKEHASRHTNRQRPKSVQRATLVKIKHQRRYWRRLLFEYAVYTVLVLFVYFVLVGVPLWKGAVWWLHWVMQNKTVFQGDWAIVIGLVVFYLYTPLLTTFEDTSPGREYFQQRRIIPHPTDTALLIPCYRSAPIIGRTLKAALQIFPTSHIYVIANGNSSQPLDNTEEICRSYGVNHIWSPVGSKIIAIFIGCYAVKDFRNVLLIDDDCILPPYFPVVVSRLNEEVRCIGYTIKSVGPDSSRGSYCQQAQDLEYKLSGLTRCFAGRIGSATFPHGAISLWERTFLKRTLHNHPGFSISEDWFLGDSCWRLGGRIQICSAVFVETTTPASVLFGEINEDRGGFGEPTVFKQRFLRWNFFVANGLWYNFSYLFASWKLGRWEFATKLFIIQEIYKTLLYISTPFTLPISFIVRPEFCIVLIMSTLGLYLLHVIIFNEVHLRLKKERICWKVVLGYYMPYKLLMTLTNVASCYWSLVKYAIFCPTTPEAYRGPQGGWNGVEIGRIDGQPGGNAKGPGDKPDRENRRRYCK
ncbi:initiation-specific alpha-1,6-mannosyltransferase [Aspergillus udagawae]|uniref:Initiation-specific alpha-1,6-mannosyltransferase n=1 Tax=Aspergillus udagawae TaxID=91492 RepID=A0ABQ1BBA5_9EURO|nr:initiation-specific alpha-1,6-mannosyltransferase [Aspergillus udagawae]